MKRFGRSALLLSAALVLAAAAGKPAKAPKKREPFPPLRDRYVKTFLRRFPVVASYLGASGLDPQLAALDGKLRDFSPVALREERGEWDSFQAELSKIDRALLAEGDRIDAAVMSSQLMFLLHTLDRRLHERGLDASLDEATRGVEWLLRGMSAGAGERRGTADEWTRVAERVEAIPAYLKTALANTRRGAAAGVLPDRRLIRAAVETALSSRTYFEKELPAQATSGLPEGTEALRERLDKGSEAAGRAFGDYRRGLLDLFFASGGETLRPEFDRDRYAAGVAEYSWALRNDLHVTKSPQELFREGREQVARTLQEMTVLARAVAAAHGGNDASLPAVFRRLSEGAPGSDGHHQLPPRQPVTTSLVRWLRPGGVEDSTSMWEDSMATEGWALYAEELVGLPRPEAPEERLVRLRSLALRQALAVVDPGLHCGFMTFDEAIAYLARNVYFVRGPVSKDPKKNPDALERAWVETAEKEITRCSKWPTQAVTHVLGKQAILELKAEVKAIEGDRFDERRFHEDFLSFGPIPPALFREALLDSAKRRIAPSPN